MSTDSGDAGGEFWIGMSLDVTVTGALSCKIELNALFIIRSVCAGSRGVRNSYDRAVRFEETRNWHLDVSEMMEDGGGSKVGRNENWWRV